MTHWIYWGYSILAQSNLGGGGGAPAAPAGDAAAGGGTAAAATPGGGIEAFILPIALVAIFYFLLIRPQQKRAKKHREFVGGLKVGDRVITNSGFYGRIVELDEVKATVELGKNLRVDVLRGYLAALQQGDGAKDAEAVRDAS